MPKNKSYLFIILFYILSNNVYADELGDNSAKIQIKVGGEIDAQMTKNNSFGSYQNNILPNNTVNTGNNDISGRVKALVNLEIAVKTKNFRYGGLVGLQTGKIEDDYGNYSREAFIFIENPYGKIEMGSAYSSAARMRIDATNLARATGGIQGDWFRYIAMPVYHSSDQSLTMGAAPVFILQPMLPNEAGFTTGAFNGNNRYNDTTHAYSSPNIVQPRLGWGSLSNKISYYTKRIAGVQLGISYSPNTGLTGVLVDQQSGYAKDYLGQYYHMNSTGVVGNVNNLVTIGANYMKQFGDFGLATSFTYETGQYQGSAYSSGGFNYSGIPHRNNLNAFMLGIKGTYGPISLAYSYGNWLSSLMSNSFAYYNADGTETAKQAFFHTAGLGLTFGPINFSSTYMYSNYQGNTVQLASVGSDIKLGGLWGRGLVPYMELTYYELMPAFGKDSFGKLATAEGLKGFVIIGGLKLIF
jgi:hypothetical protein